MVSDESLRMGVKQSLREAAKKLVSNRPVNQISVKEILALSGVSRMTFYRHYQSKDDLLRDVYETEIYSTDWYTNFHNQYDRSIAAVSKHLENRDFYLHALESVDFRRIWSKNACDSIVSWLEQLAGDKPVDHDTLERYAYFVSQGWSQYTYDWLKNPESRTLDEITKELIAFTERGFEGILDAHGDNTMRAPDSDIRQ